MESLRAHVFITGKVQGVNFRAHTRNQARLAGVRGWVRNLDDGRVEAIFEGPRLGVKQLVSWCYGGPAHARVERVEVEWGETTGQENEFMIYW